MEARKLDDLRGGVGRAVSNGRSYLISSRPMIERQAFATTRGLQKRSQSALARYRSERLPGSSTLGTGRLRDRSERRESGFKVSCFFSSDSCDSE